MTDSISLEELNIHAGGLLVMMGPSDPKIWQQHWLSTFEKLGIVVQFEDAQTPKERKQNALLTQTKVALLVQTPPSDYRGADALPFDLRLHADWILCLGLDGSRGRLWKTRTGLVDLVVKP